MIYDRTKLLRLRLSKLETDRQRTESAASCWRREFHVSRSVREHYGLSEDFFSLNGDVIFANFHGARVFAHQLNQKRDLVKYPERSARAGELNAMGLIDEILHHAIFLYSEQKLKNPLQKALSSLEQSLGKEEVDRTLNAFVAAFPPKDVYRGGKSVEQYLAETTDGQSNRVVALEELLILWLGNVNPAYGKYRELFDDEELKKQTKYQAVIDGLRTYFSGQPLFGSGAGGMNLIDFLRMPALNSPHSLSGQLKYIRENWGLVFGQYLFKLLSSLDLIQEEDKITFGGGPGPTRVYEYGGAYEEETERFSPDLDWMPKVVLIAKSTLVWLDQLSKKYDRPITTLDQVPDEEIDILVSRGFTGLWLIGLWERSKASKRIKQIMGNPEAEASAYALHDYEIAYELGGWPALEKLRERCWKKGLRLASDMVPNHTGIDSRWVMHHPEWFVQLGYPPFPGYTFTGENLSGNDQVGVYLEDHYFDRSDAAVVFKRVDFGSGDTRYIYHGNDGTHMPWNDTAQLNYLDPGVREAVIQTILHVARNFPIIRFDAAMTLAKRHYQRLWFPEPGTGGDIASRSEHGLKKDAFDAAMPEEFWREVVDRVQKEVPDTLLLAEAFWMMESYFVRSLGMHRVYNSAFMNMLRNEENEKYRLTIKKTQEFDPEILKRFVNFMNNPDEETAVRMFGKGDKYFGVCMLMVTMPGLPMFGHGQVEGFAEKYGMEYRRAYWEEEPDQDLIRRHEHEIFPLMKKRYIFAEAANFMLYDLHSPQGGVNENVYAYSNRAGNESALVLFNNSIHGASGWIKVSAPYADRAADKQLRQKALGEALGLHNEDSYFVLMREHMSNLWFIRSSRSLWEEGLFIHLDGYQYQVFTDVQEVSDDAEGHYRRLAEKLNGAGVQNIDEALKEIYLKPILDAVRSILDPAVADRLTRTVVKGDKPAEDLSEELGERYREFLNAVRDFSGGDGKLDSLVEEFSEYLSASVKVLHSVTLPDEEVQTIVSEVAAALAGKPGARVPGSKKVYTTLERMKLEDPYTEYASHIILGWLFFRCVGPVVSPEYSGADSVSLMDQWFLDRRLKDFYIECGMDGWQSEQAVRLVKILISHEGWTEPDGKKKILPGELLGEFLSDTDVTLFIGENRYNDVLWFKREGYRSLVWWLYIVALTDILAHTEQNENVPSSRLRDTMSSVNIWLSSLEKSEYRVDRLLEAASGKKSAK